MRQDCLREPTERQTCNSLSSCRARRRAKLLAALPLPGVGGAAGSAAFAQRARLAVALVRVKLKRRAAGDGGERGARRLASATAAPAAGGDAARRRRRERATPPVAARSTPANGTAALPTRFSSNIVMLMDRDDGTCLSRASSR